MVGEEGAGPSGGAFVDIEVGALDDFKGAAEDALVALKIEVMADVEGVEDGAGEGGVRDVDVETPIPPTFNPGGGDGGGHELSHERIHEGIGAVDGFETIGAGPARVEVTVETEGAGGLTLLSGAEKFHGFGASVEIGADGGARGVGVEADGAGVETGAPEENERAEGEEKAAGGGEATTRECAAGGEGEADGGGEEGGEGGPDKRADGKRLAGEERGERGVGTEERAVSGLAEGDPSEDEGEEEQAGDDEIGATGGGAEAAGGGRETDPSEHGPQDDEDAGERIVEVGDV